MARYLLFFWSLLVTPIWAQIDKCEILTINNAVIISEYMPCSQLDSFYISGNHYICFNGSTVHFKPNASFNKYLTDHIESNVCLPDCLSVTDEDPILDYIHYDYTYNLYYSRYERKNLEKKGRIDSNDIYKRRGKRKLYVAYSFSGEIVMYKTKKKVVLHEGFSDTLCKKKTVKTSKFAVLKKAKGLRSLYREEVNTMGLKKVEYNHILLIAPE